MASRRARSESISAPVRGALWVTGSTAFFALTAVLIRLVAGEVHPFEIAFFRNLFGIVWMLPWLARAGPRALGTRRQGLLWVRAFTASAAQLSWFLAVTLMPLAQATALNFTTPLFGTLGAALILREVVGPRRAGAVLVGAVGAAIILRPGLESITVASFLVLQASAFQALTQLAARALARTESPNLIVFYMSLMMTPLTGLAALFVWSRPSWSALGWLALMGLVSTLGQQALVRGYRLAEAAAVMPFNYARLIFMALFGYALFGEVADAFTWAGATVIFAATFYVARREALTRRARARAAAAPPP
ncbi:MAG: hypothetical protein A3J29_16075 [Acidobacteria bacterium RIFCSPLOWO2_12_FULL_67_14b]|nr:MAG: hypothetical protein A3J29_16075 [Acidobacteria bacterium RIFCSPLOWO2_12_FULL_67_14b]